MAVGFKLSNVLSFELTDHHTIIVTTKHIVYEMDFDDAKRSEEFMGLVSQLVVEAKKREKVQNGNLAQKRKSFYLEDSKNNEFVR
jgi:hypothetical protein